MYDPLMNQDPESGQYDKQERSLSPSYEFAETTVRQGFIRKVMGLLAVQLALTMGVTASFLYYAPVKVFVASNIWTLWAAFIASFVIILVLSFWEDARRRHPINLIMLFAFTLCEAVLVGAASVTYDTQLVLLAGGITTGVVAGLALFATQSKVDLTPGGGILMTLLFTLLFASVLQAFIHVSWLELVVCAGGALLFSAYLVFDIQLLMGTGAVSISADEYVFASLSLYLDILNLFLYILRFLNELSKSN
mmetsp:Transcript_4850/g.8423  ORF Transcript_4850/g.8423 Transcript_4850/m.8423 type:complete len:250 (-) Transcript_4850:1572-2321(-)|eukprot:CAMPEP_0119117048 /NCGR_PEP_ID=MMETSP1180-20130426/52623_1 /TAXON_ID=3052 ORGANISM="Chlamydomonas cf sp, Strain CCMP681" /NCGR_SAMPLE_ID=MMETSP1180 /ASSEMBLY_ACC=CAM_ASM_000741 /LENGTH=249 /DNA_ID=CAMNT_0007106263 /DNA_START=67 /DNA_END=816 /DNA_ORIENTATION=+